MIQETSVESYSELDLSKTELIKSAYYSIISCYDGITDREVLQFFTKFALLNYQPKARRFELYKSGNIMCIGKRKCSISGKKSMIWVKNDLK